METWFRGTLLDPLIWFMGIIYVLQFHQERRQCNTLPRGAWWQHRCRAFQIVSFVIDMRSMSLDGMTQSLVRLLRLCLQMLMILRCCSSLLMCRLQNRSRGFFWTSLTAVFMIQSLLINLKMIVEKSPETLWLGPDPTLLVVSSQIEPLMNNQNMYTICWDNLKNMALLKWKKKVRFCMSAHGIWITLIMQFAENQERRDWLLTSRNGMNSFSPFGEIDWKKGKQWNSYWSSHNRQRQECNQTSCRTSFISWRKESSDHFHYWCQTTSWQLPSHGHFSPHARV